MAKNLNDVLAALPPKRRAKVEQRAGELATLKDFAWPLNTSSKTLPQTLEYPKPPAMRVVLTYNMAVPLTATEELP